MRLPQVRRHHLLAAALLAVLAGASLLLRGPVKGKVETSVPTTYSTEPGGLQGLFMVCDGVGLPAGRFRGRLEDLDPGAVPALAVAGDPVADLDLGALLTWVEGGGRLLLATDDPRLLGPLGLAAEPVEGAASAWFPPVRPGWEIPPGAGPPRRVLRGEGLAGAEVLARASDGAGAPWILAIPRGEGAVVLLADVHPLTNEGLANPSNAVLSIRLLEEAAAGAPIEFCETVHGYGASGDPDAAMTRILLHTPFGNAALGAGIFALLLLLAEAKRFGRVRRTLEKPRRSEYEYLDALAGLLASARAWPQAGRLLLLGVARRSGREGRRGERLTVGAVAESLSWDRPAEAAGIRAGAEALASGSDPRGMVRGLAALDRALPPERPHGTGRRN